MATKNDYKGGNHIVDCIMEIDRCPRELMESAAAHADRVLNELGCATRPQAELLIRELQREEDLWLQLKISRVGLPTLFSMGAMIVSILAFCIATGIPHKDSVVVPLFLGVAVLAFTALGYWGLELHWFIKAEKSGDISTIRELHRSLSAWLLLSDCAPKANAESTKE